MNVSWGALSIIATIVTPALVLLFFLKLTFPKLSLAASKDTSLLLVGCLLAVLFNLGTIGEMAGSMSSNFDSKQTWEAGALKQVLSESHFTPVKPMHWFSSLALHKELPAHDIGYFFWNLHATPLILGLLIWLTVASLSRLELFLQYVPYNKSYIAFKAAWRRYFQDYRRYVLEQEESEVLSDFKSAHLGRLTWYNQLLNYFRATLYHPWALLTQTNRYRELLIVDVLMEDGDLYSGLFTSYVPDGNDLSALSMEYIVKYDGGATPRRKSLLKNNGELVIPARQIKTVHFWEIRRNFAVQIVIANESWIEVLKWYLLLAHLFPGFFERIRVAIPTRDVFIAVRAKVLPWLTSNRLSLKPNLLVFMLPPQALQPTATGQP